MQEKKSDITKEWFTSQELADLKLKGLSAHKKRVITKAVREGWTRRPRAGKRGGGYEYHVSSLPLKARIWLLLM